jgi:hypothetical protein
VGVIGATMERLVAKGSTVDSEACRESLKQHVEEIASALLRIQAEEFANLREMEKETGVPRSTLSFLMRKLYKKNGLSDRTITKLRRLLECVNAPAATELVNDLRAALDHYVDSKRQGAFGHKIK